MKLVVNKTTALRGEVKIPGSKSHSIRALIIALLSEGKTEIRNLLSADDITAAKTVCAALNMRIVSQAEFLQLDSVNAPITQKTSRLNSGNSGITTCFILPVLGLRKNYGEAVILNCHDQMRNRPIKPLIQALKNLGMNIVHVNNDEKLPVQLSGSLDGGKTEVDGSNSQYLSALLLSLPCASHDSEIRVKNLQERPYVEMTLSWLRKYKIDYEHASEGEWDIYRIPGKQKYKPQLIDIPGDYSSAAYAITASCVLPAKTIIQGLKENDCQGDKRLIEIVKQMGADITVENNQILINGGKPLSGTTIDAADVPDLLPVLAVLGTYAKGKTAIINVAHARIKETDRIVSMRKELIKLGAKVAEQSDGLTVWESKLTGCALNGHDDHRTVMALSIAGMMAAGTTVIDTAESINKTYPTYVESMQELSADMRLYRE